MAKEMNLETIRHSMAHVMAEAVLEIMPEAKIAIGPSIENGFYYDFDLPRPLTDADLETITEHMKAIIKSGVPFERKEISRDEARTLFADQPYKLELRTSLPMASSFSRSLARTGAAMRRIRCLPVSTAPHGGTARS